jgi:hypothetical protein
MYIFYLFLWEWAFSASWKHLLINLLRLEFVVLFIFLFIISHVVLIIVFVVFFLFVSVHLVWLERPQIMIWHVCSMLDTKGNKHTLRICNTYCFSTATVVAQTCLSIMLCVHSLSH